MRKSRLYYYKNTTTIKAMLAYLAHTVAANTLPSADGRISFTHISNGGAGVFTWDLTCLDVISPPAVAPLLMELSFNQAYLHEGGANGYPMFGFVVFGENGPEFIGMQKTLPGTSSIVFNVVQVPLKDMYGNGGVPLTRGNVLLTCSAVNLDGTNYTDDYKFKVKIYRDIDASGIASLAGTVEFFVNDTSLGSAGVSFGDAQSLGDVQAVVATVRYGTTTPAPYVIIGETVIELTHG
jgi:hypothetical protein